MLLQQRHRYSRFDIDLEEGRAVVGGARCWLELGCEVETAAAAHCKSALEVPTYVTTGSGHAGPPQSSRPPSRGCGWHLLRILLPRSWRVSAINPTEIGSCLAGHLPNDRSNSVNAPGRLRWSELSRTSTSEQG